MEKECISPWQSSFTEKTSIYQRVGRSKTASDGKAGTQIFREVISVKSPQAAEQTGPLCIFTSLFLPLYPPFLRTACRPSMRGQKHQEEKSFFFWGEKSRQGPSGAKRSPCAWLPSASSQARSLLPGLGCQGAYHVTARSDSTHLRLTYGLIRRDGLSQSDSFSQKLKPEAGNTSPRNRKKPKHSLVP